MSSGFKVLLAVVILGLLGLGLLPPLFDEAHLRTEANDAAQAGANSLVVAGPSSKSFRAVVTTSLASHKGVRLASLKVDKGIVTVVVKEQVRTFMSGTPGLKHWFDLTVTESASEAG